jgi:hypothetical protein
MIGTIVKNKKKNEICKNDPSPSKKPHQKGRKQWKIQ